MTGIAISYRREDTGWITGRIFDRLKNHYENPTTGEIIDRSVVFLDYDSIPMGVDFREHIKGVFENCDILLVVIGPHWIGNDGTEKPRISRDNDWVRIEIETALTKNVPVIPLLIDRTPMPSKESLPEEIQNLVYRQAAIIDTAIDFNSDMARLIHQIDRILALPSKKGVGQHSTNTFRFSGLTRIRLAYGSAIVIIAIIVVGLWLNLEGLKKPVPEPVPGATANSAPLGPQANQPPVQSPSGPVQALAPVPGQVQSSPSFDCKTDHGTDEIAVCNNDELSSLDRRLKNVYDALNDKLAAADKTKLINQQKSWLKQRALCKGDITCLARVYESRITQLKNW